MPLSIFILCKNSNTYINDPSFKENHIDKAGHGVAGRLINNLCNYVDTVGKEAELREKNEVLDIPNYVIFRRETSAIRPCFDLVEYCLDLDLPQYVHDDPLFISGYNAGMDLIFWANVKFPCSLVLGYKPIISFTGSRFLQRGAI
jgi:hypothetical protein